MARQYYLWLLLAGLAGCKASSSAGQLREEEKSIPYWIEQFCGPGSGRGWDVEPVASRRIDARNAIVRIGAPAVPFLMAALEVENDLGDCVVDLVRSLHEAGKLPDQSLVNALRAGPG